MVEGYLYVTFRIVCVQLQVGEGSEGFPHRLSDQLVMWEPSVHMELTHPGPVVLTWNDAILYPQPYQQLCINRVDGCLSVYQHCLKTDLHR